MKKATFLCAVLSILSTPFAFAQLYQGPDSGSVPFGGPVSTDNFLPSAPFSFPGPIFQEPRNEIEVEPLPPPPGMMHAFAPEGSNYHVDPSLTQGVIPTIPPLQLHSFQGVPDQGTVIPPDPYVAAGPDQVITVVNQRFRIWDKSGNLLKTIDAPSWYSNVYQNNGAFDPKIAYDPYANRWIMVWLQQSDADSSSHFLLSVSDSSSALGTPFRSNLPRGSKSKYPEASRRVAPLTATVPGSAAAPTRAAMFGVPPNASVCQGLVTPSSPTTVVPVWTPIRTARRTPCSRLKRSRAGASA